MQESLNRQTFNLNESEIQTKENYSLYPKHIEVKSIKVYQGFAQFKTIFLFLKFSNSSDWCRNLID